MFRMFALAALLAVTITAASGCRAIEVRSMTVNVTASLNLPVNIQEPRP